MWFIFNSASCVVHRTRLFSTSYNTESSLILCLGCSCELSSSDLLIGFRGMMAAMSFHDSAHTACSLYDALSFDTRLFPDLSVESLRRATNFRNHEGSPTLAGDDVVLARIYMLVLYTTTIHTTAAVLVPGEPYKLLVTRAYLASCSSNFNQ